MPEEELKTLSDNLMARLIELETQLPDRQKNMQRAAQMAHERHFGKPRLPA